MENKQKVVLAMHIKIVCVCRRRKGVVGGWLCLVKKKAKELDNIPWISTNINMVYVNI